MTSSHDKLTYGGILCTSSMMTFNAIQMGILIYGDTGDTDELVHNNFILQNLMYAIKSSTCFVRISMKEHFPSKRAIKLENISRSSLVVVHDK